MSAAWREVPARSVGRYGMYVYTTKLRCNSAVRDVNKLLLGMKRLLLLLIVCLSGINLVLGQTQTITGTVVDASNEEPVIGASIVVQGTSQGSITSVDGSFSLQVAPGAKLVISFIGMKSQVVEAKMAW